MDKSYHARSELLVENANGNFSNRLFAKFKPYAVLEGEIPGFIGKWQEVLKSLDLLLE